MLLKLPLSLWWMWLLSEVYSEHHRHRHFTRRWVLDRHNPLKRLLQKHTQKSRYCIYKDNRKSAEVSIKWQSSGSVISRFYWKSDISLNTTVSIPFILLDYFCIFVSPAVAFSLMCGGEKKNKTHKKTQINTTTPKPPQLSESLQGKVKNLKSPKS